MIPLFSPMAVNLAAPSTRGVLREHRVLSPLLELPRSSGVNAPCTFSLESLFKALLCRFCFGKPWQRVSNVGVQPVVAGTRLILSSPWAPSWSWRCCLFSAGIPVLPARSSTLLLLQLCISISFSTKLRLVVAPLSSSFALTPGVSLLYELPQLVKQLKTNKYF